MWENDIYRFNRGLDYGYDVELFQSEIALAEKNHDLETKIAHYKTALRFYKGPYLPEIDGDWSLVERQRLEQLYFGTLLKISHLHLELGQHSQALKYCQHALDQDICMEDAHQLAMQIFAAMGNRAAVIRQYEQCRRALFDELAAPPSGLTQALYQSLIQ